jgi:hypothetical protein
LCAGLSALNLFADKEFYLKTYFRRGALKFIEVERKSLLRFKDLTKETLLAAKDL